MFPWLHSNMLYESLILAYIEIVFWKTVSPFNKGCFFPKMFPKSQA